jgi:DNA-binding MarR family transcriptional regulator
MKQTKEEREKTQLEIMEFLFKLNAPERLKEIASHIQQSESETQYHCDELRKKGWIHHVALPAGRTAVGEGKVYGFVIAELGRKFVMES